MKIINSAMFVVDAQLKFEKVFPTNIAITFCLFVLVILIENVKYTLTNASLSNILCQTHFVNNVKNEEVINRVNLDLHGR